MATTGVVRKIDNLGRIVIPKEMRRIFDLKEDIDSLDITVVDDAIVMKKYEPACIFCHSTQNVQNYKGRSICSDCLKDIAESLKEDK